MGTVLTFPTVVAQEPTSVAGMDTPMLLLSLVVAGVISLVIPAITEALTTYNGPRWLKSLVTAALSTLNGVLTTVAVGDYTEPLHWLAAVGTAWAIAGRAYLMGLDAPVTALKAKGSRPRGEHALEQNAA